MLPTVADVLRLDAMRRGRPEVMAGADRLDNRVRWVHVIEITDAAHLLRGGELVLITGIALPDAPAALRTYVGDLAAVGVSGLAVELGRKYQRDLPAALIEAAQANGLPLITLERETPFVEITEAVHALIIDEQLAELRASQHLHEVFTELSVDGAGPEEVIDQVARITGAPVILENMAHQVLACVPAGQDPATLLAGWETRSRGVRTDLRTGYDDPAGWLVTTVGARGEDWGRLIIVRPAGPSTRDVVVIERAAATLALGRLLERHQESLERQAHGTVIAGIITRSSADSAELTARARALGVPLTGRALVAAVLRPRHTGSTFDADGDTPVGTAPLGTLPALAEAAAAACRRCRLPALVGMLDEHAVSVLLALPPHADPDPRLTAFARRLRTRTWRDTVIGVGSVAHGVREVRRSFDEAGHVAAVAAGRPDDRPYHRLPDLRLRGLVHLLRDDARLQTFVERELGALLSHDATHHGDLTGLLRDYLTAGRNKALAAQRAHLSRPALYQRLAKIGRLLDVDLDDVESCTSLHVALLALESVRHEETGDRRDQ